MAPGERRSGTPRQLPDLEVCYCAFQLRARGQALCPLTRFSCLHPGTCSGPTSGPVLPGPCSWECVEVSDCLCCVHWVISNRKDWGQSQAGPEPFKSIRTLPADLCSEASPTQANPRDACC